MYTGHVCSPCATQHYIYNIKAHTYLYALHGNHFYTDKLYSIICSNLSQKDDHKNVDVEEGRKGEKQPELKLTLMHGNITHRFRRYFIRNALINFEKLKKKSDPQK